jgi:hypothetical protein
LTGGCLCGSVRYEVAQPLVVAAYCHCTRCQRRSGSAAAVSALAAPGSVRMTAGEELLDSYDPPDGGFSKVFCSACGGALFARHPTDGDVVWVRMGTFDSDPGIRPSYRQYVAYAAPWEPIPEDGLPRYPERRPASA